MWKKFYKKHIKKHIPEYIIILLFVIFLISIFWLQLVIATSTFFITLLTGVLIFLLGQLILRLIIEPILEVRRTIGKIAYTLKYYANIYNATNISSENAEEAIDETRKMSCELETNYNAVIFKQLPSWVLPEQKNIAKAAFDLIYVSNNIGALPDILDIKKNIKPNYEVVIGIKKLLNIRSIDEEL